MAKYIDLEEFVSEGYLQLVNRLALHPFGLALEVTREADGSIVPDSLRVQDHRDDPEGVIYEHLDVEKTEKVVSILHERFKSRFEALGYWIQP